MNKWYRPFGFLLIAAMVGDLSGCAQTRGLLTRKSSKKDSEEKVAAADKKAGDKKSKGKPTKTADAKSADTAIAKKSKTKSLDAEHEKFTAAHASDKKKTKDGKEELEALAKAKSKVPTKPKSKVEEKSDDDLVAFAEKSEKQAEKSKIKPASAKKPVDEELDAFAEESTPKKKNVVQVKKEVTKSNSKVDEEDDIADWAETATHTTVKEAPAVKKTKVVNPAESFEDELETPFKTASATSSENVSEQPVQKASPASSDDWADEPATASSVEPASAKTETPAESDSWSEEAPKVTKHEKPKAGVSDSCPGASPELREALDAIDPSDSESLKQGLHRIGQFGPDGAAAKPFLLNMMKHDDPFVCVHAALATVRLKSSGPETIEVITASLRSRDASLRSFGAAVLDEMGPQSSDVLSILAKSLESSDGQVRIRAAEILIRHDDWANQSQSCLIKCLRDQDENIRWLTCYSLAELAPETPEAVQALVKASHDSVGKVQIGAVYALGEIGPYAKRAAGELRKLAEETQDEELKSAIKYTIEQIQNGS